jgi:hypothetical protein
MAVHNYKDDMEVLVCASCVSQVEDGVPWVHCQRHLQRISIHVTAE